MTMIMTMRRPLRLFLILVFCVIGNISCVEAFAKNPKPAASAKSLATPSLNYLGVPLPQETLATKKTTINGYSFNIEIASSEREQAIGLMGRTTLDPEQGMLFPMQQRRVARFWMKNMRIAIDMVFIRDNKVVAIETAVPACLADPCPSYGPSEPVDAVLELAARRASQIGLKVGQTILI